MQRFQLRLAWLLWYVAIVAAFLGGVRYGEYREATRKITVYRVIKNGFSPAEAWWRTVAAVAAVRMLADWPRPPGRSR